MGIVSSEIEIDATTQVVCALVSDVTRTGEWSPECVPCRWSAGNGRCRGWALLRGQPGWLATVVHDLEIRVAQRGLSWCADGKERSSDRAEVVHHPFEPVRRACRRSVFDGLAQFYRQAYLRWIDTTKKRPDERARRIAEMIDLPNQEKKQRP